MQTKAHDMGPSGELLDPAHLKREFHDRHEWRAYRRAVEVAKALLEKPELVENGSAYLETFVRPDPLQAKSYRLWRRVLQRPPQTVARLLVRDTPLGSRLRDSAPVFVTFTPAQLREIWREP